MKLRAISQPYANSLMKRIPSVNAVVDLPKFMARQSSVDNCNQQTRRRPFRR
jgi:hypothetical protein